MFYFAGECIALTLRLSQTENAPLFCFAYWISDHMDFVAGELQEHRTRFSRMRQLAVRNR